MRIFQLLQEGSRFSLELWRAGEVVLDEALGLLVLVNQHFDVLLHFGLKELPALYLISQQADLVRKLPMGVVLRGDGLLELIKGEERATYLSYSLGLNGDVLRYVMMV